jgi:hypothetical protein
MRPMPTQSGLACPSASATTDSAATTPDQEAAYRHREAQVLAFSLQLGSLRQRHAACLAQTREHEEAARLIHEQPSS